MKYDLHKQVNSLQQWKLGISNALNYVFVPFKIVYIGNNRI